jgi:hypothetical protein
LEATVKRDQKNQLCAKGDHIISYRALPHVLNVKRVINAEEAIELFVLLLHLVTLDKKIVLNALPDLSAQIQVVPNFHHQFARTGRLVWKALQLVLYVKQVSTASKASIITVLLEHTTPILDQTCRQHVYRALQDRSAQKGRKRQHHVVLEIIVIQALQYVPRVLLEHSTPFLHRVHVKCALQDRSVQKGRK